MAIEAGLDGGLGRGVGRAGVRRRGVVAGRGSSRDHVSGMQRARLIGAAVWGVEELGWSGVTVSDIASRARVSRRTFYDLFSDREDCLLAMLTGACGCVERELQAVDDRGSSWVERVRAGLWEILSFLDREPVLARVCVVQSARGSLRVLEAREEILSRLAGVLEQARFQSERAVQAPALTGEGLVGAALAIVHRRLLSGEGPPLTDLHRELMGMIVLPYLGSAIAVRERNRPFALELERDAQDRSHRPGVRRSDPLREIPMRLTYRTARVLQSVGHMPGVSNRVIGEGAGITDQGQISKLLARLERIGLLANTGEGHARGESNAWHLTPLGRRVTEQLSLDSQPQEDVQ